MLSKIARAVSTIWTKESLKNARLTFFFFLKLNGQRGFSFLSDYDSKLEKEDESKKDIKRIKLKMNEL